jgi:hypothetical protein
MKKAFVKNPYLPPPFGQNKTLNRRPKQHCNQQPSEFGRTSVLTFSLISSGMSITFNSSLTWKLKPDIPCLSMFQHPKTAAWPARPSGEPRERPEPGDTDTLFFN